MPGYSSGTVCFQELLEPVWSSNATFAVMSLSPESRLWLYVSSRPLSLEETAQINREIEIFCRQWAAHGVNLEAAGSVLHDRFIVLMVDESRAGASGCSIDSSVHFVRDLERNYGINLFNRMLIPYLDRDGAMQVIAASEVKQYILSGVLNGETRIFNTTIQTKRELDTRFLIPLKESWLARYLNPVNV